MNVARMRKYQYSYVHIRTTSELKSFFSLKKWVFTYTEYNPIDVSLPSVSISPIHLGMVTAAEGSVAAEYPIPESVGAQPTNSIPMISRRVPVT